MTKQPAKTVTIQQIASPLRREFRQSLYLKSLGLGKMNRVSTLKDSPSVRGLLVKASHLVKILP